MAALVKADVQIRGGLGKAVGALVRAAAADESQPCKHNMSTPEKSYIVPIKARIRHIKYQP
jgi:hypothetical protein